VLKNNEGNSGPLTGIRIVEMATVFNGPVTGYMLGDLGAEVIKVEPPITGDLSRGMSSIYDVKMQLPGGVNATFLQANRNKKSVILNLKNEKGKEVFYRLIEKSDVFITNYLQKTMKKLKIDYDTLRQFNNQLIYAETSTFGSHGPISDRGGYDMSAQAFSGAMWISGDRDFEEPTVIVGSVFDQVAASMLAYGVTAALLARERTGVGQKVECSLSGSAIHMQAMNMNPFLWGGRPMTRFSRKRCRNPLTNYYRCSDGKWILITEPQSQKYWHDICEALEMLDVENDSKFTSGELRRSNYADLIAILDRQFANKTREEWLRIFGNYNFAFAPVYEYADLVDNPQVLENEYIVEMDDPTLGKTKIVGFPVQFSETPARIYDRPPEFGEHTEQVLNEVLGYSWDEISDLGDQGALR